MISSVAISLVALVLSSTTVATWNKTETRDKSTIPVTQVAVTQSATSTVLASDVSSLTESFIPNSMGPQSIQSHEVSTTAPSFKKAHKPYTRSFVNTTSVKVSGTEGMKPPKTVTVTVSSGSVSVITIHPLPNTTNPIRLPTNTTLPSEAPFPNATTPSLAPQVSTLSTVLGLETDEPAQRPPAQIPNPIPSKTTSLSPLQALSSVERPDVFTTPVFPPDQPSQRPPSPTSVIPSSPESASPLAATTLKSVEAPESGPAKAPPVVDTFEASTEPAQTVTLTAATLGSVPGLEIEPTQRPATVQAPPGAAAQIQETKSLSVPIIIAPLASLLESVGIAALGGGETSVGAAPPPATAGSDSKAPLTSTARVSTIVESPLPASVPGASEIIAPPPESVPGAPPPSIPTLSTFVTSIAEGLGSVQEAATTSTSSTTSDVAAAPTVTTPPPAEVFQGATAQLAVPRLKAILGFMGLALVIGRVLL